MHDWFENFLFMFLLFRGRLYEPLILFLCPLQQVGLIGSNRSESSDSSLERKENYL